MNPTRLAAILFATEHVLVISDFIAVNVQVNKKLFTGEHTYGIHVKEIIRGGGERRVGVNALFVNRVRTCDCCSCSAWYLQRKPKPWDEPLPKKKIRYAKNQIKYPS